MSSSDLGSVLGGSPSQPPPTTSSRRVSLVSVAAVLAIAVALLFAALTWERWWPATPVTVVRVVATTNADNSAEEVGSQPKVAFQASGWVEADPYLVRATWLVDGIVDSVAVLEGQQVAAGDVLAVLDTSDLILDLGHARVHREAAAARYASAKAAVMVAGAELVQHSERVRAAAARLAEADDEAQRLADAGASIDAGRIARAAYRRDAATAEHQSILAERGILNAQRDRAASEQALMQANLSDADLLVQHAALNLERATLRAPIDGVVQRLLVVPGRKVMRGMDDPLSASAVELYNPNKLQVRVDVPLAEAGRLRIGQEAIIDCNIMPGREWRGAVSRIEGQADVTRNTLQAKIEIRDDPQPLRPEMLCRARFLSGDSQVVSNEGSSENSRLALWIPLQVVAGAVDQAAVMVMTADGRAEQRQLKLGSVQDNMVRVTEGLRAGERVLVDPPSGLAPGERVVVAQELEP